VRKSHSKESNVGLVDFQPLVNWMDEEITKRLAMIEVKLDHALADGTRDHHFGFVDGITTSPKHQAPHKDHPAPHSTLKPSHISIPLKECSDQGYAEGGTQAVQPADLQAMLGNSGRVSWEDWKEDRLSTLSGQDRDDEECGTPGTPGTPGDGRGRSKDSGNWGPIGRPHGRVSDPADWTAHRLQGEVSKDRARQSMLAITLKLQNQTGNRSKVVRALWSFFEDHDSSKLAKTYSVAMPYYLFLTVLMTIFQFLLNPDNAMLVETIIEIPFVIEIVLRFIACPSKHLYFHQVFNYLDIAAAAPLILRVSLGFEGVEAVHPITMSVAILLGVVPVLRLLKVLRHFQKIHLLLQAFLMALEALPVMIFIFILILLVFTFCVYVVEVNNDMIDSYHSAMWCCLVSMTTVGYGDVYPETPQGRLFIAIAVVITMLYMSMPLGIIGSAFSEVWGMRHHILLLKKTRSRLNQWGYKAADIPKLFDLFDSDNDGELVLEDFRAMVVEMGIGIAGDDVSDLFQLFDNDGGGTIDSQEFVKVVFPEVYHAMYADSNAGDGRTKTSVSDFAGSEHGGSTAETRLVDGSTQRVNFEERDTATSERTQEARASGLSSLSKGSKARSYYDGEDRI